MFPSLLPEVWGGSAVIRDRGEDHRIKITKWSAMTEEGPEGRERSRRKGEEMPSVDRSAQPSARPQRGAKERRVKVERLRTSGGLPEGREGLKGSFRKWHFKGNESSCLARAV